MTKQKKSFLDKIISSDDKKEKYKTERINLEESKSGNDNSDSDVIDEIEAIKKIENENSAEETADDIKKVIEEEEKKKERIKDNGSDNDKESGGSEEGQLTIDVYQSGDFIVIKSIIGGAKPDDLDISITSDMVTIKGVRENPDEIKANDYYYQECFWGNFSRSVILPCDIKIDEVKATMKNGILTIKLPKIEKNSSVRVKVEEE